MSIIRVVINFYQLCFRLPQHLNTAMLHNKFLSSSEKQNASGWEIHGESRRFSMGFVG